MHKVFGQSFRWSHCHVQRITGFRCDQSGNAQLCCTPVCTGCKNLLLSPNSSLILLYVLREALCISNPSRRESDDTFSLSLLQKLEISFGLVSHGVQVCLCHLSWIVVKASLIPGFLVIMAMATTTAFQPMSLPRQTHSCLLCFHTIDCT